MSQARIKEGFAGLNKAQLVAAAEYFGTETEGGVETLRVDLEENGITWKMYTDVFRKDEKKPEGVVTSDDVNVKEEETVPEATEVVTAAPVAFAPQSSYLIKMTRKNPYFEFKKYKFTQDNPYAIMPAEDAQEILSKEEGFRQAFPAELQEFYS